MIPAIPTPYRGIMFRSRLEAVWAAFLDELAIPWDYEPLTVELDGYIPDFILKLHEPTLLEIKPTRADVEPAILKARASGWEGPMLIGLAGQDASGFGSIVESTEDARRSARRSDDWDESAPVPDIVWNDLHFSACRTCRAMTPHTVIGSWDCRRCGRWSKNLGTLDGMAASLDLWQRARNAAQWRPR